MMASALAPPLDLPVMLANRVPLSAISSALRYSTEAGCWCSGRKALDILLMSLELLSHVLSEPFDSYLLQDALEDEVEGNVEGLQPPECSQR